MTTGNEQTAPAGDIFFLTGQLWTLLTYEDCTRAPCDEDGDCWGHDHRFAVTWRGYAGAAYLAPAAAMEDLRLPFGAAIDDHEWKDGPHIFNESEHGRAQKALADWVAGRPLPGET